MITDILTATPAEIDGQIAFVDRQLSGLYEIVAQCTRILARGLSDTDAAREAHEDQVNESRSRISVLETFRSALTAEYDRRGGWPRLYVVDNHNGHAHRTTVCSTTYASTDFYWFPEHSGKTDAEIVALTGGLTCLTCFGSQRAEIEKGRPSKLETPNQAKAREERETQAAARDAKKAKATANGIADVDGSPLLDDGGYVIKTLRTAQIKAVDALEQSGLDAIYADQAEDDPSHVAHLVELSKREREYAVRLVKAIAAKQDRPLAEVLDEIATKAEKKLAPARKDEAARKAAGKTAREWYAR